MSLIANTLNLYGRGFSSLGRFAFSPMPFSFFTLPISTFFIAPVILATFIPIVAIAAIASCIGGLFDSGTYYSGVNRQTVVVSEPWYRSWVFSGLFDPTPTRPCVSRSRYNSSYYDTTPAAPRSWPSYNSMPSQPHSAPTTSSSFFGGPQHVVSHSSHMSGPAMPTTAPTMGGRGNQYVR